MNLKNIKENWIRNQTLLAVRVRKKDGIKTFVTILEDEDELHYLFSNKEGKPILVRKPDIIGIEEAKGGLK